MTLTEFLLARIADVEELARGAMNVPEGVEQTTSVPQRAGSGWRGYNPDGTEAPDEVPISDVPGAPMDEIGNWGWSGGPVEVDSYPNRPFTISDSRLWDEADPIGAAYFRATVPASAGIGTVRHILSHDPASVLAECEAKRKVVESADEATGLDMQVDAEFRVGRRDVNAEPYLGDVILRHLAMPYADHPDYRPEWRP